MICYSVLLGLLFAMLPLNVYRLHWNRCLPRVLTVGFVVMGVLVCLTAVATALLHGFFSDVCTLGEGWLATAYEQTAGVFEYVGCRLNASILAVEEGNTTGLATDLTADICSAVCACAADPIAVCTDFPCNSTECAQWSANGTVAAVVGDVMEAVRAMLQEWQASLTCRFVYASLVDPLLDICKKVLQSFCRAFDPHGLIQQRICPPPPPFIAV